ncbi:MULTISPECIES: restriction endonuclease subunit S [unclassified Empedobacter]|uniref:restriction endonuclease subunit S n=1 Tax=unclassified Empedobacter TaxID=2643773 RepID=UPI0024498F9C|nr:MULTISPECIES: restriction endonuclease subunit S [unclassified Empedobacter]MDH2208507.1 restriction endonuclease subunit S [Empedobacter sp. GD03644]
MSYKILGDYIRKVDNKNKDLKVLNLQGLSMTKEFRKSTSNIVGTDLSKYKIVKQGQFCCDFMSVIRVHKLPVVLNDLREDVIISPAYIVFEVIDTSVLLPEYLMLWFRRSEFDRYADFRCDSSIRGGFQWEELCEVELPIPSIEKQSEIVAQYEAVANKIKVNEQICEKLEATAQALYKQWFVDFEFPFDFAQGKPNEEGQPYKSSGGAMVFNEELENEIPEGWEVKSLSNICDKIASGSTPSGGKENYKKEGISLIRSMNVHDLEFIYDDLAYIDEDQSKKLSNVVVKPKDLLFNITGVSVARCTIVPDKVLPARVNQHVMIIRPKVDYQINHYLLLNLTSTDSKNELLGISQSGSTREAITKTDIENFKIIVPQSELLNLYNLQVSKQFDLIEILRIENQKLTQLQSLLLSRLARLEG